MIHVYFKDGTSGYYDSIIDHSGLAILFRDSRNRCNVMIAKHRIERMVVEGEQKATDQPGTDSGKGAAV